ncbi:uncharacterized protein AAES06_007755 isoform 3-T3 [Glossophaga mutica]
MSRSRLEKHQVHDDTVSHHLLELSNKLSGEALAMHLAASTTSLRGRPCSAECPSLRSSQGSLTPGSLCSHRMLAESGGRIFVNAMKHCMNR